MVKNQVRALFFIFIISFVFLATYAFGAEPTPSIIINKNDTNTETRKVNLTLSGIKNTKKMIICNNPGFNNCNWEAYKTKKKWVLDYGVGNKTVYVRFKDSKNKTTETYQDTIYLFVPTILEAGFLINDADKETNSRYVELEMSYTKGLEEIKISNFSNFQDAETITPTKKRSWILTPQSGLKTVYVEFGDANGSKKVVQKSITYIQPKVYIPEASLIKGQSGTIYYFGYDGRLHSFGNMAVFHSWQTNFNKIVYVSPVKLKDYEIGMPVCMRPGSWLVKFSNYSKIYSVGPGCLLWPIMSEAEAYILYGPKWRDRIVELDSADQSYYKIRNYSVADAEEEIIDDDEDGVDKDTEKEYGSSDKKIDSDSDGLSDPEEIYIWFSDPTNNDTDKDGVKDGKEVTNGNSPVGMDALSEIPENSYVYPPGSIVRGKSNQNQLYYYHTSGFIYNLSKYDKINSSFIINPFFDPKVQNNLSGTVTSDENEISIPTVIKNNNVIPL